jgi:hypothetical protein
MSATSSKLNSSTVKENVAEPQTLKVTAPKEANNNKGRDDLSQEKKKAYHQVSARFPMPVSHTIIKSHTKTISKCHPQL